MAQKVDTPEKISLYQGEKKRSFRGAERFLPLLLVLAGLFAVHFLNLFLHWTVVQKELSQKPAYHTAEYSFLGFSPINRKKVAAAQLLPNAAPSGRVFAFFDPLHKSVFMVWNNSGEENFFDLGPVLVAVPAGASRISFFPDSIFLLRHGKKTVARNYGGSILGGVWARFLNEKYVGSGTWGGRHPGSFVVKPAPGSLSLRIPYLVYFYLPLALVIVLIATSGAGMAAAFFYYASMFFLFDFEKLFITIPWACLFNALGVELPDPWVKVLAVVLALFFLAAAVYGILHWKSREMPPSSKWIIWFFILVPFFLFF